jgi:hypothetical protein
MAGLRKRLKALEARAGVGGCPECQGAPGEGLQVRIYGLPPKPGPIPEHVTYAPPGEKPDETCPACGKVLPVIRLKGLEDKPRGPAPA